MSMNNLPQLMYMFPQDIITKNSLFFEKGREMLFTPSSGGSCGSVEQVLVFCNKTTCIFWQMKSTDPFPECKKIFKLLFRLQEYIDMATYIMNYDPTTNSYHQYTAGDGITRKYIIELNSELCYNSAGASYNGRPWIATTKEFANFTYDTINKVVPTIHQAFFYELGRSAYDVALDDIADWQMQNVGEYGYLTLGFNGAMTVLGPENMGVDLSYNYQGTQAFRDDRINDLETYINNSSWTFENTWCQYLLPWSQGQSINDLMSGLFIRLADMFGGIRFLSRMFYCMKQRPTTPNKTDRHARANNIYQAVYRALMDLYDSNVAILARNFFVINLRWRFVLSMN